MTSGHKYTKETMSFVLKADYRENRGECIITKLKDLRSTNTVVSAKQYDLIDEVLTTGDYVIYASGYILIIERKTWADLAQSFADGRIFVNHLAMLSARKLLGVTARLMYMIEGKLPTPGSNTDTVSGITKSAMIAKLDHFVMRDNVMIEYTLDGMSTAKRLLELGKNMSTLDPFAQDNCNDPLAESEPRESEHGQVPVHPAEVKLPGQGPVSGGMITLANVDAVVKSKRTTSDADLQVQMLMCVPGIGKATSAKLLAKHTFAELMRGSSDSKYIELSKTISGERPAVARTLLAKIKGISSEIADTVLAKHTLSDLCQTSATDISTITKANGRKLGISIGNKIKVHFI
jgi:ERCC4-type nuclease